MDPRKTPRLVLRFNAPNNGEGDSVAKNPRIRLLKGLENPRKQKGHDQVARRLSKFDTRMAEVRWKTMEERFRANVSLSKFDSCGSPFEDLEPIHAARTSGDTPETSWKHLSSPANVISILDKRNIRFLGNLCLRNLKNLLSSFFIHSNHSNNHRM